MLFSIFDCSDGWDIQSATCGDCLTRAMSFQLLSLDCVSLELFVACVSEKKVDVAQD